MGADEIAQNFILSFYQSFPVWRAENLGVSQAVCWIQCVCFIPQDIGEMVKMFGRLFSVELTLSNGEIGEQKNIKFNGTLNSNQQTGEKKKNCFTDMKRDVVSWTFLFVIWTVSTIGVPWVTN